MIDLHVHTCYSDGEHMPGEIVRIAKNNGVSVIAITDHDSVGGIDEAIYAGRKCGVFVVPGIEITAFCGMEIHVLGYNIDYKSERLNSYIKRDRVKRENDIIRNFEYLRLNGVRLTEDEVYKFRDGEFITVWHFAKAICAKGYALDVHEAMDKFFIKDYLNSLVSDRISVKEAIALILDLGGVPVLAHPVRLGFSFDELVEKVKGWKEIGLQGIEALYSMNSEDDTNRYLKLAKDFGLGITIGSDYHGEHVKENIKIGTGIDEGLSKYSFFNYDIKSFLGIN